MRNILIPTDFSNNARMASHYALYLFKDVECTFYFLNAFQLFHFTTDTVIEPKPGEKAYEQAKENSVSGLENFSEQLRTKWQNPLHEFQLISMYSSITEAAQEVVKDKLIDMIVMGTRGEKNIVSTIYGSNAVDLMQKVMDCPVLVVPDSPLLIDKSIKEIVFATNFKSSYRPEEFHPMRDIAKRHKATIQILYVQESKNNKKLTAEQEKNKMILEDILKDLEHSYFTLTNIAVATGIHSFIESRDSDMLVLFKKKHNFFDGIFSRSLIKDIGYKPEVPVMVLNKIKQADNLKTQQGQFPPRSKIL